MASGTTETILTMTHASLFSGIGGFDLAAEWAGWTNAFNCEISAFCRQNLAYYFHESKQYYDVTTTDFSIWRGRIDVLSGGFPCQPFSIAGKRRGSADDRYLWPAMLGAIRAIGPRYSWVRTFPELLIGRTDWFSNKCVLIWKTKVTKSSRFLFRLVPSVPRTDVTEYGLLPTVQTQGLKQCEKGKTVFMPLGLLPTPTATDAGSGRTNRSPSPGAAERPTLALAAKRGLLPTPTANDAKNATLPKSQAERKGSVSKMAMGSDGYQTGAGSRLNPLYVTEMMGFPVNWLVSPFLRGAENRSKHAETP